MTFVTLDYAKNLMNTDFIKAKDYFLKSILVVQYLIQTNYTDEQIIKFLNDKFEERDSLSEPIRILRIKDIIHFAKKRQPLENKSIYFSTQELEYIKSFDDFNLEKLLFVMFSIYKFNDGYFSINNNELMKLSKLNLNHNSQISLLRQVYNNGIFDIGEKKNRITHRKEMSYWLTEKAQNLYDKDCIALEISDYDNLILYYLMYFNYDKVTFCIKCGKIFKQTGNNQIHCKECNPRNPIGVKTIICCDCGKEFEIDSRNMTKVRCDECQKKVDNEKSRLRMKKYRSK